MVPAWFLVVVQDVRGQGDSQGSFTGFSQEASDTADTLNWLRELPEVNGRIGLYGFSYQGLTQLLAPEDSPPPDCMAPAMCGLDERNHWSCEGEAHWWHLGLGWGQLAALQARRRGDQSHWEEIRRSLEDGSYLRMASACWNNDPHGMAVRWFHQPATMHPRGSSIPFRSAGCRRPCCCSAAGGTRICEASWISRNAPAPWVANRICTSVQPPISSGGQSSQLLLNFSSITCRITLQKMPVMASP